MLELMILLAIAVAAYMAWNIGANDVANAMGTSVGSGALTLRNAIIIAAVFEFCGAFFAGDAVTDTVRKGVLVISEEEMASLSRELQYGFIAAMLAAALWITVATRYGLPVSTTHSIIGGIIGFGLFIDPTLIDFQKVGQIFFYQLRQHIAPFGIDGTHGPNMCAEVAVFDEACQRELWDRCAVSVQQGAGHGHGRDQWWRQHHVADAQARKQ